MREAQWLHNLQNLANRFWQSLPAPAAVVVNQKLGPRQQESSSAHKRMFTSVDRSRLRYGVMLVLRG